MAMGPKQLGRLTSTMRLDDEVTFAMGNISGQQLCLSKLFSRQPLCQGPEETNMEPRTRPDSGDETDCNEVMLLISFIRVTDMHYFFIHRRNEKINNPLQKQ